MPVTRRLELFEWVNRIRKRYIIEDDYDSEFRYTGRFILPLYAQDTQSRVIYMNTFSKSLVPSLRISYMVLPPRLFGALRTDHELLQLHRIQLRAVYAGTLYFRRLF